MTSLVSASQVVTGQVQSLDSVRAHALPSDAMIFASATKVQPANQNLGSYAIVESMGIGVTTTGSVPAVTQSPFADVYKEGSIYFNGSSGNYLSNTATTFTVPTWSSTGMTVECWVNYSTFTNAGATPALLGFMNSGTNNAFSFGANASGVLTAYYWNGSSGTTLTSTGTLSANTWNHIVFCCSSTPTATMYLNGTQVYSAALVGSGIGSIYGLTIGQYSVNPTAYVASVRINFGTPLYTGSSFTVPSAPLSPAATGTNAFLLRVGSNAPTVQNGALTFDRGLKQYMNFGPQTLNLYTRGFSFVFRYQFTGTVANNERLFQFTQSTASPNNSFAVLRNGTGSTLSFSYYNNSGTPTTVTTTGTLSQATTYVLALVYAGSTVQWWINGVPNASGTLTLSSDPGIFTSTYIGCDYTGASSFTSMTSNTLAIYNRALSNVEILNAYSALTTSTVNAPIEIGDANGTPALSIAGDGRVNITKLGQTSNVLPWPPAAMTGYVTSINGGTYVASASSDNASGGFSAWFAFDKTTGRWSSNGADYTVYNSTAATCTYAGTVTTVDVNGTSYPGQWIQIQIPSSIVISNYQVQSRYDAGNGSGEPRTWAVLGSRDGVNWVLVDQRYNVTWSGASSVNTPTVAPGQAFVYFRLVTSVVGAGFSGQTNVVIGEWTLYGTADTAQTLTVAQPVTLSYGAQTASLTGISGDKYVPQDFSSSGLNIPSFVVSNTATVANTVAFSSFGPFAGEGSVYFPGGSRPVVAFPSGTSPNFTLSSTSVCTYEAWIYPTSVAGVATVIFGHASTTSSAYDWILFIETTQKLAWYPNTGTPIYSTNNVNLNAWNHVAWSFTGGSVYLALNGVVNSASMGSPSNTSTYSLYVGNTGTAPFYGYIACARIVSGLALYQTTFTPPTGPLQPIQGTTQAGQPYGTVLLLRNAPAPGRVLTSKFGGANSGQVLSFPTAAMTGYSTALSSGYGQGVYVASASTDQGPTYASWCAFDKSNSTVWLSVGSKYSGTTPYAYTGSVSTVDVNGTSYAGEWLQIQMPSSIVLANYTLRSDQSTDFCSIWSVLGSRDGTNWFIVDRQTQTTAGGATNYTYTVTSGQAFSYYRLAVAAVSGSYSGTLGIVEWTLNGTIEGPSISADGRLGLGVTAPTQALEVAGSAVVAGTVSAGNPLTFKNKLINGNFDIWQRGTSFSSPGAGAYTTDRWFVNYNGSGATRTVSRQTFALGQTSIPGNPKYYYQYAQTVAGTGGTYNVALQQHIESVLTLAGQPVTVSFWANVASGTTTITSALRQYFGSGGSPSALVDATLTSGTTVTTAWQLFTFTTFLPSISGKTLGTDGNDSLQMILNVPVNATVTLNVSGVQVEAGSVATPFEIRPYATELALCQRYYQTVLQAALYRRYMSNVDRQPITFPPMRAAPTGTPAALGTPTNLASISFTSYGVMSGYLDVGYTAGGTGVVDIPSGVNLNLSSEL